MIAKLMLYQDGAPHKQVGFFHVADRVVKFRRLNEANDVSDEEFEARFSSRFFDPGSAKWLKPADGEEYLKALPNRFTGRLSIVMVEQ